MKRENGLLRGASAMTIFDLADDLEKLESLPSELRYDCCCMFVTSVEKELYSLAGDILSLMGDIAYNEVQLIVTYCMCNELIYGISIVLERVNKAREAVSRMYYLSPTSVTLRLVRCLDVDFEIIDKRKAAHVATLNTDVLGYVLEEGLLTDEGAVQSLHLCKTGSVNYLMLRDYIRDLRCYSDDSNAVTMGNRL